MRPSRHIRSALRRLAAGGRLVGADAAPHDPASHRNPLALRRSSGDHISSFSPQRVNGRIYARHGTSVDTRLTVIDRIPDDPGPPLIAAGHADSSPSFSRLIETQLPPSAPSLSLREPFRRPRRGPAQAPFRSLHKARPAAPASKPFTRMRRNSPTKRRGTAPAEASFSRAHLRAL